VINETLNDNEKAILNAMRENIELEKCFLEMIDITHKRIPELRNGDDAEEAVVHAIQKTGNVLLQEWAEKQEKETDKAGRQDKSIRPHGKKK
jgi:DNA-binding transcriptional regulator YiaG